MPFKSLGLVLLGGAAIIAPAQASQSWNFHFDHVLGTSLDIVAVAVNETLAGLAVSLVQAEIARLEPILSGWRSDSELAALNASAEFHASSDLFNVIAATEKWRAVTGGAFSARLGQLEIADRDSRKVLAAKIDNEVVTLDNYTQMIERPVNVTFAVDGLAKGYIIDKALEAARGLPGVHGLMVDIGGDLRCWGQPPNGDGWRIGVVDACNSADNAAPVSVVKIADKAVATSGRGLRAQTIFEPWSGAAADKIVMATAIANCAADADALASAFAVMAPRDSLALADSLPGVAAHIVDTGGQTYVSRDWSGMVVAQNVAPKPAAPVKAPNGASWPAGFSVQIEYELLPGFGGRRARNPYLTIWITNDAGDLVRILTFQADQYRYMHDNYVFWRKYGDMNLDSVTRPTRSPGHYIIEWDGKDDKDRAVPQGKYTVNVESARENGFHSMQRIEMNLGVAPVSGEAPPQEDMGVIRARYGKTP